MQTFTKLQTTLKTLSKEKKEKLIDALGYTARPKPLNRINKLLEANDLKLYLQHPHYDFHYDSVGFLKAVSFHLGIEIQEELQAYKKHQTLLAKLPQPYIYIDTNFKRKSEPIFALAFLESKRRILLDKEEVLDYTKEQIEEKIGTIVKEHYNKCGGKLPLWGKIDKYIYHHIDKKIYFFDPNGICIEIKKHYPESKATLTI